MKSKNRYPIHSSKIYTVGMLQVERRKREKRGKQIQRCTPEDTTEQIKQTPKGKQEKRNNPQRNKGMHSGKK